MLLLKIQSLSYGHSGIQLQTVELINRLYNRDVLPVIYRIARSLGDLAPLAHLSPPLLGNILKGKSFIECFHVPFGWEPIVLRSKEGLAL
jgi:histidine ammonia-lyase